MYRVSRLLAVSGLVDPFWFTQASRDRGTVVHAIAESVLRKEQISVAPKYEGYVTALTEGFAVLGLRAIHIEQRIDDGETTGRPDVLGWMPIRVGRIFAGPVIVDVKTGEPSPTHGLQLAFYEKLANSHPEMRKQLPDYMRCLPWSRVGLYVRENGTHTLRHYEDFHDAQIVEAILDVTRWRIANGLLAPGDPAWRDDDPITPEETDGERRTDTGAESREPADPSLSPASTGTLGAGRIPPDYV